MKKEIYFFKQDGKWYADIPEHTLEENEMVMGSDLLLDMLSGDYDIIKLTLDDEEPDNYLLAFKIGEHDDDGAYYTISGPIYNLYVDTVQGQGGNDILDQIWICNVTHDVFGEHPKEIYLTDIHQEKSMTEEEMHKEYDKKQCVYGENSTMPCMFCSATCKERYEDFKEKGVRIEFLGERIEFLPV